MPSLKVAIFARAKPLRTRLQRMEPMVSIHFAMLREKSDRRMAAQFSAQYWCNGLEASRLRGVCCIPEIPGQIELKSTPPLPRDNKNDAEPEASMIWYTDCCHFCAFTYYIEAAFLLLTRGILFPHPYGEDHFLSGSSSSFWLVVTWDHDQHGMTWKLCIESMLGPSTVKNGERFNRNSYRYSVTQLWASI